MNRVERFLADIDKRWRLPSAGPIALHVIGSAALLLQTDYTRGTKDSDIIRTRDLPPDIEARLVRLAGEDSELGRIHRLRLDFIEEATPFLPQSPEYIDLGELNERLSNFKVFALAVTDVVVSRYHPSNVATPSPVG